MTSEHNTEPSGQPPLDATQVTQLLDQHFPQMNAPQVESDARLIEIEHIADAAGIVRLKLHDRNIRPGGTISGPAMFTLCDVAVYALILSVMGEAGLQAVTTNLNINFLSRPSPCDLIARTRLIKQGRRLIVGEVELFSEGSDALVAHATATYALPPKSMR